MPNPNVPFHPIIYVRGFAMTQREIDETSADPFNGFNIGSTVYRATPDKNKPRKFVFESPLVRLASEFGYQDVYEDGCDVLDAEWEFDATGQPTGNQLTSKSIIIHRYYDEASTLLGAAKKPSINDFAQQLSKLIHRVRELICQNPANGVDEDTFKCYLVAHSMGGLVCRAMLQNPQNDPHEAYKCVDKLFTYATPHNGIDMGGMNVPGWLDKFGINTFNRDEMAKYLGLNKPKNGRVDWLPENRFRPEKVFCMVGTNRLDYDVGMGMSRTFAGNGSDGLVRIENATLQGLKANGQPGEPCAKAFAYRSHSGFFGIVNSEEAYQNLTRFLFGDVRVDIFVDIAAIRLPTEVQAQRDAGRAIDALYQFEVQAAPRAKPWFLTRRMAVEDSVACLKQSEWDASPKKNGSIYLSTVFLANHGKVNKVRKTLAYALTISIRVPDYEIERKLWFNDHYEGRYLFRDTIILELTPPTQDGGPWKVMGTWQGTAINMQPEEIQGRALNAGRREMKIVLPTDGKTNPGIEGQLRLVVSAWNSA